MAFVVLLGRVFYSLIFIMSIATHFSAAGIDYASKQGVPFANIAVPLSGLIAIAGGVSILLGLRARIGAWLLVLFLVPVTFMMHNFWAIPDPMMAQIQQAHFMKNLALLGAAMMISYFGSGPLSLDRSFTKS